jgi:hypothetical protein
VTPHLARCAFPKREAFDKEKALNEDVSDGLLPDIRETSLFELLDHNSGSSLDKALERLLTSHVDSNFNSFGSSI